MGTIDPAYYTVADGDGHTKAARQAAINVGGDSRPVAECRRRIRGARGQRPLRLRGERLERPFAHLYETGGMRRV